MGRVYLARQLDLGRQVVVKVMHDHLVADAKFNERFQRETLLMARFQHPYAVTLYDASLNDPQGPCIIMEYIRGVTLEALLRSSGHLSPERAGRLLGQLCEALQAAHSEGIIHRDLKPANLMVVDADSPYEKIKVMDFGLAKLLAPEAWRKSNDSGAEFAIGTPGYMCPEQAKGDEMDHRGDLYSVGVILYELMAGRLPFSGLSTMETLLAHATELPPSFAAAGAANWVPPAIEAVVLSCLAKSPNDRPGSARELAERYEAALLYEREVLEQPPAATTPTPAAPLEITEPAYVVDPNAVIHRLEAWMPEKIAAYKLRGFVEDVGGEVIESVPGMIRVRVGGRGSIYARQMANGWLSMMRRAAAIEIELRLNRSLAARDSQLSIAVIMRSLNPTADLDWRERCTQIFCDLRAYLMGQNGVPAGAQP